MQTHRHQAATPGEGRNTMSAFEDRLEADTLADDFNVVQFRPRPKAQPQHVSQYASANPSFDEQRFPVDIRGNITFGRLMSGLSTVGLSVRVDARSGRVIIADELSEEN